MHYKKDKMRQKTTKCVKNRQMHQKDKMHKKDKINKKKLHQKTKCIRIQNKRNCVKRLNYVLNEA